MAFGFGFAAWASIDRIRSSGYKSPADQDIYSLSLSLLSSSSSSTSRCFLCLPQMNEWMNDSPVSFLLKKKNCKNKNHQNDWALKIIVLISDIVFLALVIWTQKGHLSKCSPTPPSAISPVGVNENGWAADAIRGPRRRRLLASFTYYPKNFTPFVQFLFFLFFFTFISSSFIYIFFTFTFIFYRIE